MYFTDAELNWMNSLITTIAENESKFNIGITSRDDSPTRISKDIPTSVLRFGNIDADKLIRTPLSTEVRLSALYGFNTSMSGLFERSIKFVSISSDTYYDLVRFILVFVIDKTKQHYDPLNQFFFYKDFTAPRKIALKLEITLMKRIGVTRKKVPYEVQHFNFDMKYGNICSSIVLFGSSDDKFSYYFKNFEKFKHVIQKGKERNFPHLKINHVFKEG